jgi:predicted nucleotidyltransferase
VDVVAEIVDRSLFRQAVLQGDLGDLLGCPVPVVTTHALTRAWEHAHEHIEREAALL